MGISRIITRFFDR